MEESRTNSKRKKIQELLKSNRYAQSFEAAARFQAMKLGAKWIDTYPKLHQAEG